ncbi:ATP-binding protein [Streptomyces sp. NPDC057575]|uniref:ATP-binding protein n=1 Tax=Streptomyces sp. NPDC057575 TaxID=3346170 RepID=UPI003696404E
MAENRRFPVLVGRQPQTKLLTPALVQAEDGASGSTVLLRGEAGVGKSTLAAWVRQAWLRLPRHSNRRSPHHLAAHMIDRTSPRGGCGRTR